MRALYIHISGLVGLLVFLKEVLNYTPIERTILVAATTGITVYLMLIVGHSIVMRIMAYSPPQSAPEPAGRSTPHAAAPGQALHHPAAAPSPAAAPAPGEAADHQTADANAAAGDAEPDAGESDDAPESPGNAPEASASPPDRAPDADRPDADAPAESLAQPTA